jgi:hypothetical protein
MIKVRVDNPQGVLSPQELAELQAFIIDRCYCTTTELNWLWRVILRDDGNSGYRGYWAVRLPRLGVRIEEARAIIVLNTFYLVTLDQMFRTLAHEYGHHWTLMHLLDRFNKTLDERVPAIYYRIRGLEPDEFASDCSKGWERCDKEVMAEDYKYHFSPYKGEHRMQHLVGNPTGEVKDYIWSLGKPHFI